MNTIHCSRRDWLKGTAALSLVPALARAQAAAGPRPKVAAVFTEFRLRSHAFHILTSLMGRYLFRGEWRDPGIDVVSFYADQFPRGDMAREASERFKVPLYKTIDEALCLGGQSLAVDAVCLIGEHGRYPKNDLGQTMYPRKQFFDQIVKVVERSGRPVPVFNDKHLSYRWDWARQMYDDAQRLKMPFLAGSSVPLAERRPPIEFPAGAVVEQAVSIHGGGIESYDFHALEIMQSQIEARRGGETGVKQVQLLEGDACKKAHEEGLWSKELVNAAMDAERNGGMRRRPRMSFPPEPFVPRHALVVTYRDGARGTAMTVGSGGDRWNFACQLKGRPEPLATAYYSGPWGNWNLFNALSGAIAHFFRTGKSPYPVERTLLASGILDAAMHSRAAGGKPIDTPELDLAYQAQDFRDFCETGPSWRVITPDMPEPDHFEPGTG